MDQFGTFVVDISGHYVGGFMTGEGNFSVVKGKNTINSTLGASQNRRNIHLLRSICRYFGKVGSMAVSWPHQCSSSFYWSSQGLQDNYGKVLPKQEDVPIYTSKQFDKNAFVTVLKEWKMGQRKRDVILANHKQYRQTNKEQYLEKVHAMPVIDQSDDWVAAFTDADGGVSTYHGGYIGYSQKDLLLLKSLQQYFGGVGKIVTKGFNSGEYIVKDNACIEAVVNKWICKNPMLRTDQLFKRLVLKKETKKGIRRNPLLQSFLKKIKDPMPAMRYQLHARKALGLKQPVEIDKVLREHYPLELALEYKLFYQSYMEMYNQEQNTTDLLAEVAKQFYTKGKS